MVKTSRRLSSYARVSFRGNDVGGLRAASHPTAAAAGFVIGYAAIRSRSSGRVD